MEYTALWRSWSRSGETEGEAGIRLYRDICGYALEIYGEGGICEGEKIEPVVIVDPSGYTKTFPCSIEEDPVNPELTFFKIHDEVEVK